MKTKWILGLLVCTQICLAQDLELTGSFSAGFLGAETIRFTGPDSFYFDGFYCTYGVKGKGRCEIRGNYLYLYFEKSKKHATKDSTRPPLIVRQAADKEQAQLKVTCLDQNRVPVPFASVRLKGTGIESHSRADHEGFVYFEFGRLHLPVSMEVSSVGYQPAQLKIDSFLNHDIRIFLKESVFPNRILNNGEVRIYEMDMVTEDLILMRPLRSKEPFRKYHKQKEDGGKP